MAGPLHPRSSHSKVYIVVIIAVLVIAVVGVVMGGKGALINDSVHTSNTDKSSDSSCIGSETMMMTLKGEIKLKNLKVGDKILTFDRHTKSTKLSTIHWIRVHNKTLHYKVHTTTDTFILSPEHLVLLNSNHYLKTCDLKIGDQLLSTGNVSKVVKIEPIDDIAMSPIVLDGTVVMPNCTVVSCWSGDKDNADKMDSLMNIIRELRTNYTIHELSQIIESFYLSFLQNNKDMRKIPKILNKLNVPVRCK